MMFELGKRILIHGVLTASILGLIGIGLAEMGTTWLASMPVERKTPVLGEAQPVSIEPVAEIFRNRIPLALAGWGFAFVTLGEIILHFLRRSRTRQPNQKTEMDPAEVLLEELLMKLEADRSKQCDSESQAAKDHFALPLLSPVSSSRSTSANINLTTTPSRVV